MNGEGDAAGVSVGYNRVIGIIALALGGLLWVLGAMAKTTPTFFVAAVNTLLGILYLTRPYFVVGPHAVELKNMLGMTMRRFEFGTLGDLEASPDGKVIFRIEPNGQRTRLKLVRWLAHGPDWQRFVAIVRTRVFD